MHPVNSDVADNERLDREALALFLSWQVRFVVASLFRLKSWLFVTS